MFIYSMQVHSARICIIYSKCHIYAYVAKCIEAETIITLKLPQTY